MIRAVFAIPGEISTRSGGYAYDREVLYAAPGVGLALNYLKLPGGFPHADGARVARALALLAEARAPLLVDGLALGVLPAPEVAALEQPVVALCHHPLAFETGLDPDEADFMLIDEAAVLREVAAVVTTSETTAETLRTALRVPPERITVAAPGLARAPAAPRRGAPPVILSVGSITRRKGHDLLIKALATLTDLDWRLRILGSVEADPAWAEELGVRIAIAGIAERATLEGAAGDGVLAAAYAAADIFCLPSRYEGYGMVFAEAMMRGLPVVGLATGAVPEVVPGDAGTLVAEEDVAGLTAALRRFITDRAAADRAAAAGRAHALT
ncbi:MAG: glycosyltransferase family 4 protein, partial [Pseudomonadota bacterium]